MNTYNTADFSIPCVVGIRCDGYGVVKCRSTITVSGDWYDRENDVGITSKGWALDTGRIAMTDHIQWIIDGATEEYDDGVGDVDVTIELDNGSNFVCTLDVVRDAGNLTAITTDIIGWSAENALAAYVDGIGGTE